MNQLYFGDCLDVLKELNRKYPSGIIDLIYNDPPFNSKRNYNVLFESIDLKDTKAQKEAFADTWSNVSYHDTLAEIHELDIDLFRFLTALDGIKISKGAISYLTLMAIRIWYMHKVLKDTGSFYLHCDSNMSHYLKIICDLIFGYKQYQNEIIWQRTTNTGSSKSIAKKFSQDTDTILYYTKSSKFIFNKLFREYGKDYFKRFKYKDDLGYFRWSALKTFSSERLKEWEEKGMIRHGKNASYPEYKQYLDDLKGVPMNNLWNDIFHINPMAKEKLGYPTQKPIELLLRILSASSNPGDLVADFFCGCGTTVAAAQKLNRKWLGVDISHLAIKLILKRLSDPYSDDIKGNILNDIDLSGFPKDIDSAKELARHTDKHRIKFQDWVIEVMIGGVSNPKKSGDGGYDGYITFHKSMDYKSKGTGIIEVKSGNVGIASLRSFAEVINKQKADIGIFVCFEEQVSKGMRIDANAQGKLEGWNINKLQILTVEDLLNHKSPQLPGMGRMKHFDESNERLENYVEEKKLF